MWNTTPNQAKMHMWPSGGLGGDTSIHRIIRAYTHAHIYMPHAYIHICA